MTLRRSGLLGLGLASALTVFGCATPQLAVVDTRAADEATIRKADEDWSKAAQTKQVAAWTAYYADDTVVMPPNDKPASTREAISKVVGDLLALPNLTIGWQPVKVEAARSGDVAYARGTYDLSFKGARGRLVRDHGKYLEVWKKQPDGGWKCIVDMWSSDMKS
jgi:ketosteroid isomerase-like protein